MRTKKLALFIFCVCNSLQAQTSFENIWDSTFRNIKHIASNGTNYFWDIGFVDSTIYNYNGLPSDSIVSFDVWTNFYECFRQSSIDKSQQIEDIVSFQKKLVKHFDAGVMPVPVLFAKAGIIQANAKEEKLIKFDSINLVWTSNNPDDAFKIQNVFMATPFMNAVFKQDIDLLFSDEFFVTNTNLILDKIQIKPENGVYWEVMKNHPYKLILKPGENKFTMSFTLNDGIIYYSTVVIFYDSQPIIQSMDEKFKITNPFNLGDIKGNIYANPQRETELQDQLRAFINYLPGFTNGIQNACITKPLIIVEGIDFGFKDHPTGYYGGKCGNMGLIDLMNGYILNPYASKQKDRHEEWDAIKKGPKFIEELRQKGYDIYYLDFHNGADYIENNSMLLVKLIELINARKCGNDELVVIGASMGGVVARYALSYMEKNNMPHCVRTFVSFDAPNQGANIPLGYQAFIKYFSGKKWSIKESFKRKIDRAATRQLLIYHILADYNTDAHKDRKEFLHKLKELGSYPQKTRNIAVSNGSIDGSRQNFEAGDVLIAMAPINTRIDQNDFRFGADVYAAFRYHSTKGELVLRVYYPTGVIDYFEKYDKNKPVYDNVAGSIRYDIRDARAIYGLYNIFNNKSSTCFIPTKSALDIDSKIKDSDINKKVLPDVPNKQLYPFETYFGVLNTNEEHMKITDENMRWMIDEIEKNKNELPVNLKVKYNYGRKERYTIPTVSIEDGGTLQVNGYSVNGYGNGQYDAINKPNSTFEMHTNDCNSQIVIYKGGILELGHIFSTIVNKAILRIKKGSTLIIRENGILKINNGSLLIIEDGAELIYFPGAQILLEGDDAQLQIDGKLRLEANAVFSISKGINSRTGFVKFRNAKGGYGNASIEIGGSNTEFSLSGTSSNDMLLQIEGKLSFVDKQNPYKLRSFTIKNCTVLYANKSSIEIETELYADNVYFERIDWANPGSSEAFHLLNHKKAVVSNCVFKELSAGIKLTGTTEENNILEVLSSSFNTCINGILCREGQVIAKYCFFYYCSENGLYVYNPESDIKLTTCQLRYNENGCNVLNASGKTRNVFLESCHFTKNNIGLKLNKCNSAVTCANFISNQIGISDERGELSLSRNRTITGSGNSMAGGDNTFAHNSTFGIFLNSTVLFLDEGFNNFLQKSGSTNSNFLNGEIAYSSTTHSNSGFYALLANNNYWSPKPNNNLEDGAGSIYFVKFPYPGGSSLTMNYFTGNMLNDLNTKCFNSSSCGSCEFVVQEKKYITDKTMLDSNQVLIQPYPVAENLHIEFPLLDKEFTFNLRLFNMEGKLVMEQKNLSGVLDINTSDIANGVYILEIQSELGSELKKIIINHG